MTSATETVAARADPPAVVQSAGPWRVAAGQLVRNPVAVISAVVLSLIVVICVAAPFYAAHIAHTDPFRSNINGTIMLHGKQVSVLQQSTTGLKLGVEPIGPTWDIHSYFLGADSQGRDVMARLLYGGRTTLLIGFASAIICCLAGAALGIVAGYFGGVVDWVLSRVFDLIWAFPVYLLAISLSVVLLTSDLHLGPIDLSAGSLMLPIAIIALIYVPYIARPVRGQVLSLRNRDFIKAAIGLGAGDWRILRREIARNVLPTVIVFVPLMTALNMLTESALSFLSIGVQAPDASWGTIINDGLDVLYTRPMVALAPGVMLVLTAVAFNLLGDAVRDVLDPKAKLRGAA